MRRMGAGRLDQRVTLQEPTNTRDAQGSVSTTWADVATVWAAVEDLAGREYFAAAETQAEVSSRIIIRTRDGVAPTMRAVCGSRTWDIQAVIRPAGRMDMMHLMCVERR